MMKRKWSLDSSFTGEQLLNSQNALGEVKNGAYSQLDLQIKQSDLWDEF